MLEKRSVPRFKVPIKIEYREAGQQGEKFSTFGSDISMKGLRLEANNRLKEGDILDLFFYFPNRPIQEAIGKVAWVKEINPGVKDKFESGLYFLNIRNSLKQDIFEYIFKYFPQEIQKHWWGG